MTTPTQSKMTAAIPWLNSQQAKIADEVIAICNLNSGSNSLSGLHDVADHLEHLMRDFELPCQRIGIGSRTSIDDSGAEQIAETGPILRWDSPNTNPDHPAVMLAIHYDTVYGPANPFQTCRWIDEDKLNGPGVIDAKGGIITLRWAILAGLKFGLLDSVRWSVVLNPDEEIGSPSTWAYWRAIAGDLDYALLFEPSLPNGNWVSRRRGTGNFVFVVRGVSAHAGRHFEAGRNAIVLAAELAGRIHRLNTERAGITLNVGRIAGGDALNVVPDLAVLRVNARVEDHAEQVWIDQKLRQLVTELGDAEGFSIELHGGISSPPKLIDPDTQDLMDTIESVARELDRPISWQATGGASDGNKVASLGVPAIDTFGPEGDCLHSPNEWLRPSSIPEKAALTLGTLIKLGSR